MQLCSICSSDEHPDEAHMEILDPQEAYKEGFKAGFLEAQRCAADIAEMEADYYNNSKYKSDIMRNAVANHIKGLIQGLKHDLPYSEQELIKGIK